MVTRIITIIIILACCGTAKAQNAAAKSKDYVRQVYTQMMDLHQRGDTEAAIAIAERGIRGCGDQEDTETCQAGMYFAAGYLFQQAAKQGGQQASHYQSQAEAYYERVLDIYPDNKQAWSNLATLRAKEGVNESWVGRLEELAENYPSDGAEYYIQIGDLYRQEENLDQTCHYYQKAYGADPFSSEACGRIVRLYTQHGVECIDNPYPGGYSQITDFAYSCQDLGFPNYAEELLRKQLADAIEDGDDDQVTRTLVLWADILVENQWIQPRRIEDFRQRFANTDQQAYASKLLSQLQDLMASGEARSVSLWRSARPTIWISEDQVISPKSIYIGVQFAKGKEALFDGMVAEAEHFWLEGLKMLRDHSPQYIQIARELALLYHSHPDLDPRGRKLKQLITELFEGKGDAYSARDLRMIREYHTTLGAIFYAQKKWSGIGAANAEFQLRRALSERYGGGMQPDLRMMLADVYLHTGKKDQALEMQLQAVSELLSLDRLNEAPRILQKALHLIERPVASGTLPPEFVALRELTRLRQKWLDADYATETSAENILAEVAGNEKQAVRYLDKAFVQEQVFKGLADIASNIPDDRLAEKQMIYSNALQRIRDVEMLNSLGDFQRVQNIQNSLEHAVVHPRQLQTAQINKDLEQTRYTPVIQNGDVRTYKVPAVGKEIRVPDALFELGTMIREDYTPEMQKPETKYRIDKAKVIRNDHK